ncbi:putative F-box protein At3g10430 [Cornus florida]|uniref:putative F-box protein At3g10430 n=1 Tax=Cornus florida TaxID=4283 RepID=UPI00289B3E13|nr:putative F-box protein At3g10430 [Cornus florida]
MASNSGNHVVPEDVTVEILSRLPVKSLMRFGGVCRYWYTIIRNSSFITKHHDHHNNNVHLLVQYYNFDTEKFAFSLFPDENLDSVPLLYHELDELQMSRDPLYVLGPVNGILCLFNGGDHVALWNPTLRDFRLLPKLQENSPPYFTINWDSFAFGLDPLTKNYKVVWIRYFWDDRIDTLYFPPIVAVYTLWTNSWKMIEIDLPLNQPIDSTFNDGFINGTYYWMTSDNSDMYMIISFEMGNETFGMIRLPLDFPKLPWEGLTVYNDSLIVILYHPPMEEKYFEIWRMEKEGLWNKQLTIGPFLDIDRPLGLWKNGELFLESEKTQQLLLYNINTQETKVLGPRGYEHCLKVLNYKQSLVSLKGQNEFREVYNSSNMIREFCTS